MSIGLVFALKAEARAFLGRGRWQGGSESRACGLRKISGPKGKELIAVLTGVGPKRAAAGAEVLLDEGVDALLCAGISGGLSPDLKAGDLIIASAVMYGRDGREGAYGLDREAVGYASKTLENNGLKVRQGPIISTESAILDKYSKKNIYEKTGALAVDMESGAVAIAAERKGIPLFIMRAVCDDALQAISPELYECLDADGEVRAGQLLGKCLRRPAMVREMMALRRSYNLALSTLGRGWRLLEKAGFPYFLLEKRK